MSWIKSSKTGILLEANQHNESLEDFNTNHVSKLPAELLVEVFRIRVLEELKSLILLIHVCKHWRDVAFGAPELWPDTLVISDRSPTTKKVKFWVERSKGQIQELCFKGVAGSDDTKDWGLDRLKFVNWDRLSICRIQSWDIFRYLNSIRQNSLLDNLEEPVIDDDDYSTQQSRTDYYVAVSTIHHICLQSAFIKWLENLKHLEICNPSGAHKNQTPPSLNSIFHHNRNLETVIIDCSRSIWHDFPIEIHDNVHLHHLTRLELHGVNLSSDFFQNIIMLELQILKLSDAIILFPTVVTFNRLSELVVHKCLFLSNESLINFLRGSPSLRMLDLSQMADAGALAFELLTQPGESELLCPSLTHLIVSGCPDGVQTGPLVRLIKADDVAPHLSKLISITVQDSE